MIESSALTPRYLSVAEPRYKTKKEMALEAVCGNGLKLKFYPELIEDREVVLAAVRQNGLALRYAPAFQNDKQIVLAAIGQNGLARIFVSGELQKDADVLVAGERAIKQFKAEHQLKVGASLSVPFREKTLYIADWARYQQIVRLGSVFTRIVHAPVANKERSRFLRDSRVTLLRGGHVIPYPIKSPLFKHQYSAIIPHSANHFLLKERNGKIVSFPFTATGRGFEDNNVDQAILTAEDFQIPYKLGTTCIEGGNCFLFRDNGVPKAVIGELSVHLSLLALDEQGCFNKKTALVASNEEPSLDAYRMARNLHLCELNKRNHLDINQEPVDASSKSSEIENDQGITAAFAPFGEITYRESGKDWEYRKSSSLLS